MICIAGCRKEAAVDYVKWIMEGRRVNEKLEVDIGDEEMEMYVPSGYVYDEEKEELWKR